MTALQVDYDLPENITTPTWLERWHTDVLRHAPTLETLDAIAVRTYSDIAREPADEVRDLIRAVRAAIVIRRVELDVLSLLRNAALVALVHEARALSAYHVLPHHEGGHQVERDGISLIRCTSRQEAIAHRDVLASGRAVA